MTEDDIGDRVAILDLLARYTHSGDRGRIAELAGCFAADGVLEYPGGRGTGPAEIAALLGSGAPRDGISFVRHHVAVPLIEIDGDTASARSYFTVVSDNGPDHAGTYSDRIVRTGTGWRFAHRRVRVDWQAPGSLFRPMVTTR